MKPAPRAILPIIDAQYLNFSPCLFRRGNRDILDIDIRYLRDMDETGLALRQFYESTKIRDACDNSLNYIANSSN